MTDLPAPTIVADVFEPNPIAGLSDHMRLGTLRRVYSTPGFPPVRIFLGMARDPQPWKVQLDVLQPGGQWKVMLFTSVPPQDGYGEAEADRQAALAIRLLAEAREGAA